MSDSGSDIDAISVSDGNRSDSDSQNDGIDVSQHDGVGVPKKNPARVRMLTYFRLMYSNSILSGCKTSRGDSVDTEPFPWASADFVHRLP